MFGKIIKSLFGNQTDNQTPIKENTSVIEENALVKVGDSVKVKVGVKDPDDSDQFIEGYQGRVTEIFGDDTKLLNLMIMIEWDSITLENMERDKLIVLENEGFDWSRMRLGFKEVEIVAPRDTEEERENVYEVLYKDICSESMDEEEELIAEILGDADGEDEEYEAWETFLNTTLKFPFKAENISEKRGVIPTGVAVKVLKVHSIDEWYGILMSVSYKNHVYQLPLADLECVNTLSVNDSAVSLYNSWFANKD